MEKDFERHCKSVNIGDNELLGSTQNDLNTANLPMGTQAKNAFSNPRSLQDLVLLNPVTSD